MIPSANGVSAARDAQEIEAAGASGGARRGLDGLRGDGVVEGLQSGGLEAAMGDVPALRQVLRTKGGRGELHPGRGGGASRVSNQKCNDLTICATQ